MPLVPDQEIGRFEISVHDVGAVKVGHAFEQHQHVCLDVLVSQRLFHVLDHLTQICGHELEDEDETQTLREDVIETDHILTVQNLEILDSL